MTEIAIGGEQEHLQINNLPILRLFLGSGDSTTDRAKAEGVARDLGIRPEPGKQTLLATRAAITVNYTIAGTHGLEEGCVVRFGEISSDFKPESSTVSLVEASKVKLPKLNKLSHGQRVAWYAASLVFGLGVIATGLDADAFADPHTLPAAIIIFAACWLLGVLLLRLFLQQVDNPADLGSYFFPGRKRTK